MIQGFRGVILSLFLSIGCPVLASAQTDQEDPVRRAVRQYQVKVDQLEQMTKKVLADRKQQLQDAETRLRKHQDEAATVQRELATRNAQLNTLVARLRKQLATANAERNRLQRSLEEREAETKALEDRLVATQEKNARQPQDARTKARLHVLEDQAAKMDGWLRQLRRDVQVLLRRSTGRGRQEREEEEEEEEEAESGPADIHIHNHGGSVILNFNGSAKPRVHRDHDVDKKVGGRDHDVEDKDVAEALERARQRANAMWRARLAERRKER